MRKKICILGSGTSGLLASIMLKGNFPLYDICVVSSKQIGIIGVGEGSTEHWNTFFQRPYGINVDELVHEAKATHKYGIRFENWTETTPDYFHSISAGLVGPEGFASNYSYALENNWLLTARLSPHLYEGKVELNKEAPHSTTNQFHFDTFALNDYLKTVATDRGVTFVEGVLQDVKRNTETGWIESITTDTEKEIFGDFYIDASGFRRSLISSLVENDPFVSYRDYLPCDATAVFPTESDPSGILPYTRARAMPHGWMFEIPTQTRRGNGYIFSSDFCSEEQAVKELSEAHGKEITPARILKWKSGYFKKSIVFNCASIGLASSFIEPLEATSITTSIQQIRMLMQLIPTFHIGSAAQIRKYDEQMEALMNNILMMISMHYVSDREDTEMWRAQKTAKRPQQLMDMLALWNERTPRQNDLPVHGYEMFGIAHFWHVAQGQNLLNTATAMEENNAHSNRKAAADWFVGFSQSALLRKTVKHESIF